MPKGYWNPASAGTTPPCCRVSPDIKDCTKLKCVQVEGNPVTGLEPLTATETDVPDFGSFNVETFDCNASRIPSSLASAPWFPLASVIWFGPDNSSVDGMPSPSSAANNARALTFPARSVWTTVKLWKRSTPEPGTQLHAPLDKTVVVHATTVPELP